jgi:hypothetical protein
MDRRELVLALAAIGVVAAGRPWWEPRGPVGTVVEVTGSVPSPGIVVVEHADLRQVLEAAGVDARGVPALPVGGRVVVEAHGPRIVGEAPPDVVDLERADPAALDRLPGIGLKLAARIVGGRPFRGVDDLARVGVPAATIDGLRGRVVTAGDRAADTVRDGGWRAARATWWRR